MQQFIMAWSHPIHQADRPAILIPWYMLLAGYLRFSPLFLNNFLMWVSSWLSIPLETNAFHNGFLAVFDRFPAPITIVSISSKIIRWINFFLYSYHFSVLALKIALLFRNLWQKGYEGNTNNVQNIWGNRSNNNIFEARPKIIEIKTNTNFPLSKTHKFVHSLVIF